MTYEITTSEGIRCGGVRMSRYLIMLFLGILLAVWTLIVMSPWIIVGPWRLVEKLRGRLWLTN